MKIASCIFNKKSTILIKNVFIYTHFLKKQLINNKTKNKIQLKYYGGCTFLNSVTKKIK